MPLSILEMVLVITALALFALWLKNNQAKAPRSFSEIQSQPTTVEDLVKADKKLQAIKQLRDQTGMSLAEAKNQIEAMGQKSQPPASPEALQAAVDQLIREGKTLPAIKSVRTQTGMGLKEAKDWVEARARELDQSD